jgi:uncharacterized protein
VTLDLPAALADPAAYPFPVTGVELRETHISWVALAGDRAYKVKKPLTLPFLNYGTPERRRAMCQEEVRVNRRLAPDVYLGVVALVPRRDGGLRIAPPDAAGAVEHAVEMRRFDEAATLAAVLQYGVADAQRLEAIGARLARFHRQAEVVDGDLAIAALRGVVDETLSTLRANGAPAVDGFVAVALRALEPELLVRMRRGLAVDGHGDLRAEHVLLTEPLAIVDALEFDPALRAADCGYDLAFLLMDLARSDPTGRLGEAVLRGYRSAGGDPGSDRLRALFVVLRALVRAKVDLLRAAQLDGDRAAERLARAHELLALAERCAWTVRLPQRVVCVAGVSASGKSTVAAAIAAATGRDVLSSDAVRKHEAGVPLDEHAGPAVYAPARRTAVYRELGDAAASAAAPVIVDATFTDADGVAEFLSAAGGAPAWIVCQAPAEVLLARAARRDDRPEHGSDAGVEVVQAQLEATAGGLPLPEPPLAVLDTTRPAATLIAELADRLDARL